jgi:hypothetical protein
MLIAVEGRSVPIDLTAIPLDGYLALRPGAAVLARGVWIEGGLLMADSLRALPGAASPAERENL